MLDEISIFVLPFSTSLWSLMESQFLQKQDLLIKDYELFSFGPK